MKALQLGLETFIVRNDTALRIITGIASVGVGVAFGWVYGVSLFCGAAAVYALITDHQNPFR